MTRSRTEVEGEGERDTDEQLRAEIRAALEPSDDDKEDLISLVKRREREAVARFSSALTDLEGERDSLIHERDAWLCAAASAGDRISDLEGELEKTKREFNEAVDWLADEKQRHDATRSENEALRSALERAVTRITEADADEDFGDDYEAEVKVAVAQMRQALSSPLKGSDD